MYVTFFHQDYGSQGQRDSLKLKVFASRAVSFLLALSVILYPLWSSTNRSDILHWGEHAEWSTASAYTCRDVKRLLSVPQGKLKPYRKTNEIEPLCWCSYQMVTCSPAGECIAVWILTGREGLKPNFNLNRVWMLFTGQQHQLRNRYCE